MTEALRLVDQHEVALDDLGRRLAAALIAADSRSEALPLNGSSGSTLPRNALLVALQCLGVERALVVVPTLATVDSWGQRFTWVATPQGQPQSYGHGDEDPAVHGCLYPHRVVTIGNLIKHCEHWERQRFDLVLFDGVDAARGLDWLYSQPRRVWWLTDLDIEATTPAEILLRTGALPLPALGPRQRLSSLAERPNSRRRSLSCGR